jgi:hypothetical protein
MKQLLLIACILIGSFSANAGNGLTQSANDSAIRAQKIVLNAKIAKLQADYTANPASSAAAQSTREVIELFSDGMSRFMDGIFLEMNMTKRADLKKSYAVLELANHTFRQLAGDPAHNHDELVRQAQLFYSTF